MVKPMPLPYPVQPLHRGLNTSRNVKQIGSLVYYLAPDAKQSGSLTRVICLNLKEALAKATSTAGNSGSLALAAACKTVAEDNIVDFDVGEESASAGVVVLTAAGKIYRVGGSLGGKLTADGSGGKTPILTDRPHTRK